MELGGTAFAICLFKLNENGLIPSFDGYQILRRLIMKNFSYLCAWALILGCQGGDANFCWRSGNWQCPSSE